MNSRNDWIESHRVHADFYVGRGEDAEYLGTGDTLGHITTDAFWSLSAKEFTEQTYRDWVRSFIGPTGPFEWPHDYPDSTSTAWTYAYDKGSVYVYHKGVEMQVIRCNSHRTARSKDRPEHHRESRPVNWFPTMASTAERYVQGRP